jgi:hypothetical protein
MDKNKTDAKQTDQTHLFDAEAIPQPNIGAWKIMLPIALLLIIGGYLVYHYHLNFKAAAVGALMLGLYTGLVGWLLGVIALVPFIGPILVKILTMSFIWLLNAFGYLVSYIAIKRGYSKDVIAYRGLTIALLVGIVIGYVVAQFI